MLLSKKATCNSSHGQDSSYFLGWQEYEKNPYHDVLNPTGIIQMGLAENQLSLDIIESWVATNVESTGFHKNGKSIFRELALFQDYHGLPAFKNELAEFMGEIRGNKVRFEANNIVLTAGSTSANETLMFCLAEPGEAFLVPTPYYPGFDRDLKWRTGVKIVPIHCSSLNGFRLTESALEESYQLAQNLNLRVKGVLITNPSNPLGTTMTKKELNYLINFSLSKKTHIVSDEIFSGTVFDSPKYITIAELVLERKLHVTTDIWSRIHIVYSLSKDLGLPGFRVGLIYSNNKKLLSAATKMSSFGLVSSQTQFFLSKLLADKKFTKNYIKTNKKRIKERKEMLVCGLMSVGIKCLKSNSGLFCWADMRHLLGPNTFEGEMQLWKSFVYQVGLNICPGSSCHCVEPGWFRICFANLSKKALNISMKRIKAFVEPMGLGVNGFNQGPLVCNPKIRSLSKWVLQLSFCDKEADRLQDLGS